MPTPAELLSKQLEEKLKIDYQPSQELANLRSSLENLHNKIKAILSSNILYADKNKDLEVHKAEIANLKQGLLKSCEFLWEDYIGLLLHGQVRDFCENLRLRLMAVNMLHANTPMHFLDAKFNISFDALLQHEDFDGFMHDLKTVLMQPILTADPLIARALLADYTGLTLDIAKEYEHLYEALRQTRKVFKYILALDMITPISIRRSNTFFKTMLPNKDPTLLSHALIKLKKALLEIDRLIKQQEDTIRTQQKDNPVLENLKQAERNRRRTEITTAFLANCTLIFEEYAKGQASTNLRLLKAVVEIFKDHPIQIEYEYPAIITNNGLTWNFSSMQEKLRVMIANNQAFEVVDLCSLTMDSIYKDQIINALIVDIAKYGVGLDVNNCRYLLDGDREFFTNPILIKDGTVRNQGDLNHPTASIVHVLLKKIIAAIKDEQLKIENEQETSNEHRPSLASRLNV